MMPNFRICRNEWREKNHTQIPYIQKCMEVKTSYPISVYIEMYGGKKSCPISVYTEMNGGKNHAQFPHIQK